MRHPTEPLAVICARAVAPQPFPTHLALQERPFVRRTADFQQTSALRSPPLELTLERRRIGACPRNNAASDSAAGIEHAEEGDGAGARDTQAAAALSRALAVLPFERRAADGSFPPEQNTRSESK